MILYVCILSDLEKPSLFSSQEHCITSFETNEKYKFKSMCKLMFFLQPTEKYYSFITIMSLILICILLYTNMYTLLNVYNYTVITLIEISSK